MKNSSDTGGDGGPGRALTTYIRPESVRLVQYGYHQCDRIDEEITHYKTHRKAFQEVFHYWSRDALFLRQIFAPPSNVSDLVKQAHYVQNKSISQSLQIVFDLLPNKGADSLPYVMHALPGILASGVTLDELLADINSPLNAFFNYGVFRHGALPATEKLAYASVANITRNNAAVCWERGPSEWLWEDAGEQLVGFPSPPQIMPPEEYVTTTLDFSGPNVCSLDDQLRSCYCDEQCSSPRRMDCCLKCWPQEELGGCYWREKVKLRFEKCGLNIDPDANPVFENANEWDQNYWLVENPAPDFDVGFDFGPAILKGCAHVGEFAILCSQMFIGNAAFGCCVIGGIGTCETTGLQITSARACCHCAVSENCQFAGTSSDLRPSKRCSNSQAVGISASRATTSSNSRRRTRFFSGGDESPKDM